jgi:hypothetical protein
MSMHAGMGMGGGMGMGSAPGTPVIGYGMGGGMNMGMNMNMGMAAHEGQAMRINAPDMGNSNINSSNTNNTAGAGTHIDAAFNLCRRRVVAPGMEGQSSAFAATVDPELAGIAVRVANPQPLLLPNGFLWEFEVRATRRQGEDK